MRFAMSIKPYIVGGYMYAYMDSDEVRIAFTIFYYRFYRVTNVTWALGIGDI